MVFAKLDTVGMVEVFVPHRSHGDEIRMFPQRDKGDDIVEAQIALDYEHLHFAGGRDGGGEIRREIHIFPHHFTKSPVYFANIFVGIGEIDHIRAKSGGKYFLNKRESVPDFF